MQIKRGMLILMSLILVGFFSCNETETPQVKELPIGEKLIELLNSNNVVVDLTIESEQEGYMILSVPEETDIDDLRAQVFALFESHGAEIMSTVPVEPSNGRAMPTMTSTKVNLPDGGWAYYYEIDGKPHKVSWWSADGEWLGQSFFRND